MKSTFSIKSGMLAGILGTAAMTLFTYMAPLMGFDMSIPQMLASTTLLKRLKFSKYQSLDFSAMSNLFIVT